MIVSFCVRIDSVCFVVGEKLVNFDESVWWWLVGVTSRPTHSKSVWWAGSRLGRKVCHGLEVGHHVREGEGRI